MENDPFNELKISGDVFVHLDNTPGRTSCHLCGRKRRYFCYTCLVFLNGLEEHMPHIDLPFQLDIVKHTKELDSKSTAVHAPLMCGPDNVTMYYFPDIPDYDPKTDVLVFPTEDSITVKEWGRSCVRIQDRDVPANEMQMKSRRKVVFIDCTWNQIHPIVNDQRLQALRKISMHSYDTKFWRPNGGKRSSDHLATIEAIYYFLREYHEEFLGLEYIGQYDNILLLFKYLYLVIKKYHNGGDQLAAYKK